MKKLLNKCFLYLNFTSRIRIRIPNTDPSPAWQFESGSTQIRIWKTDVNYYLPVGTGTYPTSISFLAASIPVSILVWISS